eukprot:5068754-Pyramimonas_sp.AAC.1
MAGWFRLSVPRRVQAYGAGLPGIIGRFLRDGQAGRGSSVSAQQPQPKMCGRALGLNVGCL